MDAKKLRIRVKMAMAERDWSQEDLARHAKTSGVSISNILNGKTKPTIELLERIASALKKPLSYLLGEDSVGAQVREDKRVSDAGRIPA